MSNSLVRMTVLGNPTGLAWQRISLERPTLRFHCGPVNGRLRRILVVAGRPGEGPFTVRFADLRGGVTRTATYALASRLRASWIEAKVTKQARVAAWLSKFLASRRFRPNQEKMRSTIQRRRSIKREAICTGSTRI